MQAKMVRGIFAIHRVGDDHLIDRFDSAVDEAVVDMLRRHILGIIAVEGGAQIICGAGIYICKVPDHSLIWL